MQKDLKFNRIFIVWDIQDQSCLITIRPKMHQIRGDLQCAFFSEAAKAIVIAADNKLAILQLKTRYEGGGGAETHTYLLFPGLPHHFYAKKIQAGCSVM